MNYSINTAIGQYIRKLLTLTIDEHEFIVNYSINTALGKYIRKGITIDEIEFIVNYSINKYSTLTIYLKCLNTHFMNIASNVMPITHTTKKTKKTLLIIIPFILSQSNRNSNNYTFRNFLQCIDNHSSIWGYN